MDFDQGRGGYGQVSRSELFIAALYASFLMSNLSPHLAMAEVSWLTCVWSCLRQIFRQELETRRAAIQHQQRQYGEGQDIDTPGAAPAAKRQKVIEAEPQITRRRGESDEDED